MKMIISLSLLTFLVGCDAPQRTRAPAEYITGSGFGSASTTGGFNPTPQTIPPTTNTTGGSNGVTQGPGFESCDLSDKYQTIDIGFFGLCQSTQNETLFRFKTSLSHQSVRICLIPTYKDSSGSSTYVGNPQCTLTSSGQVVSGQLYKDRAGFSSYQINGVIVMKEPLLPEYFQCMQAYVNWPINLCANGQNAQYCAYWGPRCHNGGPTNQVCDNEARNFMSVTCNNFKSKYSNSYIDIRTR